MGATIEFVQIVEKKLENMIKELEKLVEQEKRDLDSDVDICGVKIGKTVDAEEARDRTVAKEPNNMNEAKEEGASGPD